MDFPVKSFDEHLAAYLRDYEAQDPTIDTSEGSMVFIKSAAHAAALWGISKHQEWIAKQIFPHLADPEYLEKHGGIIELPRKPGEAISDYLDRYLSHIRNPESGGRDADYINWAEEVDNVIEAWCYAIARGAGTVDVVIKANAETTGSEVASSHINVAGVTDSIVAGKLADSTATFQSDVVKKGDLVKNNSSGAETRVLLSADSEEELALVDDIFPILGQAYSVTSLVTEVQEHIEPLRPNTAKDFLVFPATTLSQAVTMTGTGANFDVAQTILDVTAYMNSLPPGQTLYLTQLTAIAIQNGAATSNVTVPSGDVAPGAYEMIRPGVINVS